MPMSNYPGGFAAGVSIQDVPVLNTYSRKVFWVDSNAGSDNYPGTFARPFATIDKAFNTGFCTANKGDVVMVKAGHAETVSTTIAMDVAGVSVIGLGNGGDMPQLTVSAADNAIEVTAANCTIQGIEFPALTSGTQAATQKISVQAADCTIRDCVFFMGASDDVGIEIQYTADRCKVENNIFRVTADGPDLAIRMDGATGGDSLTGVIIKGNVFDGFSAANAWDEGTIYSSGIHTQTLIDSNRFMYMSGGVGGVEFVAAATGLIAYNFFGGGTLGEMLDPGSMLCAENFEADAINETARKFPTGTAS